MRVASGWPPAYIWWRGIGGTPGRGFRSARVSGPPSFWRTWGRVEGPGEILSDVGFEELLHRTLRYWRGWLSNSTYHGRWREMVHRSALVLKLMVYDPTGALVASPTMGLPESIGGERNWDYRYTWLRDAALALYALIYVGFEDEARNFMGWLRDRCQEDETACFSPSTASMAARTSPRRSSRTSRGT